MATTADLLADAFGRLREIVHEAVDGLTPGQLAFRHGSEAVAAVQVQSGELLAAYYDAVHEKTIRYVRGLSDADLDRVVDKAWDPPVTLAVRLVSVISDDLQHAGQAAYLRGLIERG